MKRYLLVILLLFGSCANKAAILSGIVTGIKDGDTIEMMIDRKKVIVRLEGIDCPEKGQAFGNRAKSFTSELVFGKNVTISIRSYDRVKRAVAVVYLPDNRILNEELIRAGMAWHFTKYNRDPAWARLETEARNSKIGLWSDANPVPPWEYRKNKTRR